MYGGLLLTRWAQKSNSGREQDKGSLPPRRCRRRGMRTRCVRDEGNQGLYSGRGVIDLPTRSLLFGRNGGQEPFRGRLRGARDVSLLSPK